MKFDTSRPVLERKAADSFALHTFLCHVRIGIFLLVVAGVVGCDPAAPPELWDDTDAEVVGPSSAPSASIQVDIYLDATTSMIGYIAGGSSTYLEFLERLESSVKAGWAQADVDYFKFGARVRQVEREAFREADNPAFYRERGLFETTSIDSVIERMSHSEVSIIVTDLFQDEGDINALVDQIKNDVLRKGVDLAVLGIRSEFDGRIYDARVPAYNYASAPGNEDTYRPFYALMFGEAAQLRRVFETLSANPFVQEKYFTLISPYIVQDYTVDLAKSRDARELNLMAAPEGANRFAFNLQKDGTGGALHAEVILDRKPAAPNVSADQVELVAYRKQVTPGEQGRATDGTLTQDLTLESMQRSGDTLRATIQMSLNDPAGAYAYKTIFQAGDIGSLETPAWVREFSSDNPSPERDANKTLNLEKFVADLMQANLSVRQPKLAKAYITVNKR